MIILSFVVPIYNVENYLTRCLETLFSIGDDRVEYILIDDGSTDNSSQICEQYSQFKNVKVIHQSNGGLSSARNIGMRHSNGKYIAFLDGDDYLNPEKIKSIIDKLNGYDAFVFPFCLISDLGVKKMGAIKNSFGRDTKIELLNNLSGLELWPAWKTIVSKDFVLKHNLLFPEKRLHEDICWTSLILLLSTKIRFIDCEWYNYIRFREGSITSNIKINNLRCMFNNCQDIDSYPVEKGQLKIKRMIVKRISEACFSMLRCYFDRSDGDKCDEVISLVETNFKYLKKSTRINHKLFCFVFKINKKLAFKFYSFSMKA